MSNDTAFQATVITGTKHKLTESQIALAVEIHREFIKSFPLGHIRFSSACLYPEESFYFSFAMIGDPNDWENRILENDPIHHLISIDCEPSKFRVELLTGGRLRFANYDSIRIGFRQKTADKGKIVLMLQKYFEKCAKTVKDNAQNLPKWVPAQYLDI